MKEINLLPEKAPEDAQLRRKKRVTYIIAGVCSVAIFLVWFIPFLYLQTLTRQVKTLEPAIVAKEQSILSLLETEQLYRILLQKTNAAVPVIATKETFKKNILNMQGLLFPGVDMRDIDIKKDKVKMSVNTSDINAITTYLTTIEDEGATKFLSGLTIASISINPNTGYDVVIEGVLDNVQ